MADRETLYKKFSPNMIEALMQILLDEINTNTGLRQQRAGNPDAIATTDTRSFVAESPRQAAARNHRAYCR